MASDEFFTRHLATAPVIAIFRGQSLERTLELCHRAWDAGVSLVEVPVQSPDAVQTFRAVVAEGHRIGKQVGAGTVVTVEQATAVAAAGADFAVAPGLDLEVVAAAVALGLPFMPGVATASEVGLALRSEHAWVKAFPVRELGQNWAKDLKAPFGAARFVAVGGVSADNAAGYLTSGFDGVGVGSAFEDPAQIAALMASLPSRQPLAAQQ